MRKIFTLLLLVFSINSYAAEDVVVSSKIDTEGALLGNMIFLMLDDNNIEVKNKIQLGPTNIVRNAIKSDQIDIYPEYTGNGAFFFKKTDKNVFRNFRKGYETVKKLDYMKNKIVWLNPAKANNTWAIATRKKLAKKENIYTLEDFADYVKNGGDVKLACSEEFANREDALPAFMEAYGFKLTGDDLLILSGGNTAQTEKAAAQNINGVNFAMAYGTDGAIAPLNLLILEDTKGVQPVYAPAPIVREEILEKYPGIKDLLEPVFKSLDLETLQHLNGKIAVAGVPAKDVAEKYLKENGFIE